MQKFDVELFQAAIARAKAANEETPRARVSKGRWTETTKFTWVHSRTGWVCTKVADGWVARDAEGRDRLKEKTLKALAPKATAAMNGDLR